MFQVGDPVYDLLHKCPARVTKILQRNVERSVQLYDYEILENDDHTYLVQDNDIREPSLQDYVVQLPDGEAAIFVHDDSRNIIYELEATSIAFIDFEGIDECSYFWF